MGNGPTTVITNNTAVFSVSPTDIIKVDIVKFDPTKEAKVTILGNLAK